MTKREIVDVMSESEGRHIHFVLTEGNEYTGIVDVFENEFDNSEDEENGASIYVQTDDGCNALVYESDITFIEILED